MNQGIYFPYSKEDKKMIQGLISKGNADGLDAALKGENRKKVDEISSIWFTAATKQGCNSVLISAEALVHQLADLKKTQLLKESVYQAGFNEICAFGFFRELVSHAISTYKHRAKTGRIPDYRHWIKEDYETPQLYKRIVKVRERYTDIKWTFRKFSKNSDSLESVFFKEWLKINPPKLKKKGIVNESLTLSEIFLINELYKKYPLVIDYFVNDLKKLDSSKKKRDEKMEEFMRSFFSQVLVEKNNSIEELNRYLDDPLKLIDDQSLLKDFVIAKVPCPVFSNDQVVTIIKSVEYFNSVQGALVIFRRYLSKLLR